MGAPEGVEALHGGDERIRAHYLATGRDLFGPLTKRLDAEGLATLGSGMIVEKPIGKDGASAAAINNVIGSVFLERDIFRVGHYRGRSLHATRRSRSGVGAIERAAAALCRRRLGPNASVALIERDGRTWNEEHQ